MRLRAFSISMPPLATSSAQITRRSVATGTRCASAWPASTPATAIGSSTSRRCHISGLDRRPLAIFARAGLPANNADELVAHAAQAAKAGKPMTYASVGVGSFYHLLGAKLAKDLGIEMSHVP